MAKSEGRRSQRATGQVVHGCGSSERGALAGMGRGCAVVVVMLVVTQARCERENAAKNTRTRGASQNSQRNRKLWLARR